MSKELIDVLDENGIKTGKILSRDEIHRKGLNIEDIKMQVEEV